MKIKRTSWHYRYLLWMGKCPAATRTHCEYWSMLLATPLVASVKWVCLVTLVLLAVFATLLGLYVVAVGPLMYLLDLTAFGHTATKNIAHTAALLWGLTGVLLFLCVVLPRILILAAGTVDVCLTAYRDWRDKTCTHIDFED